MSTTPTPTSCESSRTSRLSGRQPGDLAAGRDDIDRLLAAGELERVAPSSDVADRLLADADAHIGLAGKGTDDDPAGALQLAYDAARKAHERTVATGLS